MHKQTITAALWVQRAQCTIPMQSSAERDQHFR
jgi:hypothetical protein